MPLNKNLLKTHQLPIVIAAVSLLCALLGETATMLLRYDSAAIVEGQWWRLISAHLVHLGWSHTLLNIAGLALIWGLFHDNFSDLQWLLNLLISALAVSIGLLILDPFLNWYVGLSGVLHGLFITGAVSGIRRGDRREAILLIAIVGKLLWEQAYGPMPGTADMAGGPVIVDAHLYGAIGGALAGLLFKPKLYC